MLLLFTFVTVTIFKCDTLYRELKDHYATPDINIEQQETLPELLRAILEKNPNVFNGAAGNVDIHIHLTCSL